MISEVIPDNVKTGDNVKAAYLLYCLSEKLRGSDKLDIDDFKFLASMLNDEKYKELLKNKDIVFEKLFNRLKKEAEKKPGEKNEPEKKGLTMNEIFNQKMFYDVANRPGVPGPGIGMMNVQPPKSNGPVWECSMCGEKSNTGKFCEMCGNPKPQVDEPKEWQCRCGKQNTGKFCVECGSPRIDENEPLRDGEWRCSCGQINSTNFCINCGAAKTRT